MTSFGDVIARAQDAITVERVFREPHEVDGAVVIPAAEIRAAGGGGSGENPARAESGGGGGFVVRARPVGAYVIEDGHVRWEPSVDVGRLALRAGLAAVGLFLLTRR